ncbi:MAG: OmpA family protein [Bdellovibrionales bacterium]|nr:OmpA family protein [Bdellovibrionales bacterium]
MIQKIQQMVEERENNAMDLAQKLEKEIRNEQVEIEVKGKKMIIRVQEKGSFDSGSAELQDAFFPILEKLVSSLRNIEGDISIEGHTDSIPIKTALFPSNFDLSVARALEVARGLMEDGTLDTNRFHVVGWGATRPLEPNSTPANRAVNRRVEIIVHEPSDPRSQDKIKQMMDFTAPPDVEKGKPTGPAGDNLFELDSNEIF